MLSSVVTDDELNKLGSSSTMNITHSFLLNCSSLLILFLVHFVQTCNANSIPSARACGIIHNISSPFRLKDDSQHCGDCLYELACENNVTSFYLNSHKYYVKAINYGRNMSSNPSIRLVDASVNNDDCSFPICSLSAYNFSYGHTIRLFPDPDITWPINLITCPHLLKNSSLFTEITAYCASSNYSSSYSHPSRYAYVKVGPMKLSEVPLLQKCGVDLIVLTSWKFKDLRNVSLSEIHHSLLYGFELLFSISSSVGDGRRGRGGEGAPAREAGQNE